MGFLDNVSSAFSRGTAAVERTGRSTQLKHEAGELMKRRRDLAAQLGASLYEATKDVADYRDGRESLYDGIAQLDKRRAEIDAELARLEEAAAASQAAAVTYTCSNCGSRIAGDDLFCTGCGMPADQARAAGRPNDAANSTAPDPVEEEPGGLNGAGANACPACGAPIGPSDMFCMTCGTRVGGGPAAPDPWGSAGQSFDAADSAPVDDGVEAAAEEKPDAMKDPDMEFVPYSDEGPSVGKAD